VSPAVAHLIRAFVARQHPTNRMPFLNPARLAAAAADPRVPSCARFLSHYRIFSIHLCAAQMGLTGLKPPVYPI
jgi:hypothetical protein